VRSLNDWVLYAIGAGLFVLLVVSLAALVRRRVPAGREPAEAIDWGDLTPPGAQDMTPPSPQPQAPPPQAPAPARPSLAPPVAEFHPEPAATAPVGPIHYCKCPGCQTQFSVSGPKPIVTHCPGCGKKGYLR
jgi:hypothetical protein